MRAAVTGGEATSDIVFHVNAGAAVGLGHLMRAREMARLLVGRGIACTMTGPDPALRRPGDDALFAHWEQTDTLDAAAVIACCAARGTRRAVIDDYRATPAIQAALKAAGLHWIQQFDASRPWQVHAPVLVNASPHERRAEYLRWLADPATRTLFGPRYGVLRPAFTALAPRPDGRPVRRVLAAFGGGDDRGALDLVLRALAGRMGPDVTLVAVSGGGNPRARALRAALADTPHAEVEFHVDPGDMPSLMAGCDLAVIGGGTMSYEAAICGLPMVFVALAPNQERPCAGWHDLTGAPVLGGVAEVTPQALHRAVTALIGDDTARASMAARGRAAVDGRGAARLVAALLEEEMP